MGLGDLGSVVIILLIFALLHLFLTINIGINVIKNNWDKYKCNPAIMPFAASFGHDPIETLDTCVRTTQVDFMGTFLEPIYASLNYFSQTGSIFTEIFEDLKFFGNAEQLSTFNLENTIINRIEGLINEINLIYMTIKDTFSKLGAIITSVMYIIQTSLGTASALWKNLPGTLIQIGVSMAE